MPADTPPRVIAAHALCGFGKNALGIALPVLSACGAEVYPLPTALMSSNPAFPGYSFASQDTHLAAALAQWPALGFHPDALYTGFLGSPEQADTLLQMIEALNPEWVAVDPVLGDNGHPYAITTPAHIGAMRRLAAKATLLTPNLTEARLLTGLCSAHPEELCRKLPGSASVVITGVARDDALFNCVFENGWYAEYETPRLPVSRFGTGDLFASVLVGSLLTGFTLPDAVVRAADFVYESLKRSQDTGVCFEPLLAKLTPNL
jgi:pyridoxine kinase